ncbi:YbjQ family protein [Thalassobacillus hwangdonensis]|uniref:UPF0145 protein ACFQ2J_02125 n=1 Tax=Thalassobacillus hwangdonensis TaxID=546108 RepID=A0ABW3KYW3_9BACI
MLVTTTPDLQNKTIATYHDVVCGEAIMGANVVRDFMAGISDIVGGRSSAYEDKLAQGRKIAMDEMKERARNLGANAIVGIDLDFETLRDGMMMIVATGTAVTYID